MHSHFQKLRHTLRTGLLAAGLSLAVAMLAGCAEQTRGPGEAPPVSAPGDEARAERILANLKLRIPQIAERGVEMGALEPSGIPGLDQGSCRVRGESYDFLVTADDTRLYILSSSALDVSLSTDEIEIELARIAQEKARETTRRRIQLEKSSAGLPLRGNPEGRITIVEFSDFQCPYCSRGAATIEQILEKYPDDVKFVFRHFPLNFHAWAKPAAIAANCAAKQDEEAFWILHDGFFENQKSLNPQNLLAESKRYLEASSLELDLGVWESCASDPDSDAHMAEAQAVEEDMALGSSLGVTGTPGFFVNGTFLNGALPLAAFEPVIEKAKEQES